MLSLINRKLH